MQFSQEMINSTQVFAVVMVGEVALKHENVETWMVVFADVEMTVIDVAGVALVWGVVETVIEFVNLMNGGWWFYACLVDSVPVFAVYALTILDTCFVVHFDETFVNVDYNFVDNLAVV